MKRKEQLLWGEGKMVWRKKGREVNDSVGSFCCFPVRENLESFQFFPSLQP
jgi:hypothetical protein